MIPNSAKPMDLKKKESPELMPPGTPLHDDCGCACFGSIICDDFAEE